ncbi:MAG: ankyrin repeat domain-containing protein, partial [Chlamydiota bacterium]
KIAEYLSNFSINELNRYGNALIHEAVEKGDINQVRELLQRGADINLANRRGETPLCIAASNVISDPSAVPGAKIRDNDFARNSISILRCLLANGANPNKYEGKSPLERAAKAGSFQAVEMLLEVTNKVDRLEIDPLGDPIEVAVPWFVPLMFDSYESEEWLPILGLLVSRGADLNKTNAYGNQTILCKLISKLSNIGISEETRILAGSFGIDEFIEREKKEFEVALEQLNFLLNNGVDPNVAYGPKERTALHDFIEEVDLSFLSNATEAVIERLIQAGADINKPDIDGMTSLHIAIRVRDLTVAAYLISKGANVNIKNKEGQSPLEMAEGDDDLLAVFQEKSKALKS